MSLGNFAKAGMFMLGTCACDNLFPYYYPLQRMSFILGTIWW
jgi:hypothetical protein